MSSKENIRRRVIERAAVRWFQWRGDPVARLLKSETKANPYPLYDEMRRRALLRSPLGTWTTANYDTASTVLRDRRWSSSPKHQKGYQPKNYPSGDPRSELPTADLLTMDPPDHTRLRRLLSGTFSPKAIDSFEPWIRETVDRLLVQVDPLQEFDLIEAVAYPLPLAVICRLLGVPAQDRERLRAWGQRLATTLEPTSAPDAEIRTRSSELALASYLRDLIHTRRSDPDESLLSSLIAAEENGETLSMDELVSTASLLLVAGFETTTNLIGNGTVELVTRPSLWQQLVTDPGRIPGAIEEILRFESPVQITSRTATEDLELAGETIRQGESIVVAIGGANRDPATFERPDELDLARANASGHLAFSLGAHHCLGAALARLEAKIVFEELTHRFPRLHIATPPSRRPLLVLRGYEHVVVSAAHEPPH